MLNTMLGWVEIIRGRGFLIRWGNVNKLIIFFAPWGKIIIQWGKRI